MSSLSNFFRSDTGDSAQPDAAFYLNAATQARADDRMKLAIHLYLAAFELDRLDHEVPSDTVLDGMQDAWNIACEISDRSSAETLFTELAPYSSPDQVHSRAMQLQDMTVSQLEEMGIPSDRIEKAHRIYSPEAVSAPETVNAPEALNAGVDPDFLNKMFGMFKQGPDSSNQDAKPADGKDTGTKREPVVPQWGRGRDDSAFPDTDYGELIGYESALKSMCVFGFETAADEEYRRFVKENSIFHGVEGLSLYDPFLFYGPSREDVYEFAEATAGEIGNPVVTLHVRTDDDGMWTIRLSGPFKKGFLGVSDPTDIPTPCTFVIENIDILQDFIRAAIKADSQSDEIMPSHAARAYGEILSYIHAILQKPDVFPIITAQSNLDLAPQFLDMFDRLQRIAVDLPNFEERKKIWINFAKGHASFSDINIDELAEVSEGVSRHDLITAGRNAVRDVFQESLANNVYRYVTINDVLFELVPFVSQQEGKAYTAMEDAAVEAFVDELDGMCFESFESEDAALNSSDDVLSAADTTLSALEKDSLEATSSKKALAEDELSQTNNSGNANADANSDIDANSGTDASSDIDVNSEEDLL